MVVLELSTGFEPCAGVNNRGEPFVTELSTGFVPCVKVCGKLEV